MLLISSLENFSAMSANKMVASTNQTAFQVFNEACIQRRLKEFKLPFNILKDDEFSRSREVLAAKRKTL